MRKRFFARPLGIAILLGLFVQPHSAQVVQRPASQAVALVTYDTPTTVVNDISELPSKIVTIRQRREAWLAIVREQLDGPQIDAFIDALRYEHEVNLAQGLNAMVDTGEPVAFDMATLTYAVSGRSSATARPAQQPGTQRQESNAQVGDPVVGPIGPVCPDEECQGEEEEEMDCFPRDMYGPPPPGMDWCPKETPPSWEDFCLDPALFEGLSDMSGGSTCGFGLDSVDFELFPPGFSMDLCDGVTLSGEVFFGDPPGGLFEDHTSDFSYGAMFTLSVSF